MCRFLIIKSKDKIKPSSLLKEFALMCEKSLAPDGAKQKDGYGVAWIKAGKWELVKSLKPIWQDLEALEKIPESSLIVVHARGAAFDKIGIEFNQPFLEDGLCFVFNGILKGVKLKTPLKGQIGSQKLFSLVKLLIESKGNKETLLKLRDLMLSNTELIEGMNIGLISKEGVAVLCQYLKDKDYYTLNYVEDQNLTLVSSEGFRVYNWKNIQKGEVKTFNAKYSTFF